MRSRGAFQILFFCVAGTLLAGCGGGGGSAPMVPAVPQAAQQGQNIPTAIAPLAESNSAPETATAKKDEDAKDNNNVKNPGKSDEAPGHDAAIPSAENADPKNAVPTAPAETEDIEEQPTIIEGSPTVIEEPPTAVDEPVEAEPPASPAREEDASYAAESDAISAGWLETLSAYVGGEDPGASLRSASSGIVAPGDEATKFELLDRAAIMQKLMEAGDYRSTGEIASRLLNNQFDGCVFNDPPTADANDFFDSCETSNEIAFQLARISCQAGLSNCGVLGYLGYGRPEESGTAGRSASRRSASGRSASATQPLTVWALNLYNYVNALPAGVFRNSGSKSLFKVKLDSAYDDFNAGNLSAAVSTLESVLPFLDGCQNNPPAADGNDWVTDCDESIYLYDGISGLICAGDGGGISAITISAIETSFDETSPPEILTVTGTLTSASPNAACSDPNYVNLSSQVSWTTSNSTVGIVDAAVSMFIPLVHGSTNIYASLGGVTSNTLAMTVTGTAHPVLYVSSFNAFYTVDLSAPRGSRAFSGPYSITGYANDFVVSQDKSKIFASNYPDKSIWIYDATTNTQLSGASGLISLGAIDSNFYPKYFDLDGALNTLYIPVGLQGSPATAGVLAYDDGSIPTQRFVQSGVYSGNLIEVLVAETKNKVYAIEYDTNAILVLDPDTGALMSTIDLDPGFSRNISDIALSPTQIENTLYVVSSSTSEIITIDTNTDAVQNTFSIGSGLVLSSVVPSLDESKLYIASLTGPAVYVLDAATGATLSTIALSGYPYAMAINPDGSEVYVQSFPNNIQVIDVSTDAIVETIASSAMLLTFSLVSIY